eukprot:2896026-Pyramimonas_sp.AAC.1
MCHAAIVLYGVVDRILLCIRVLNQTDLDLSSSCRSTQQLPQSCLTGGCARGTRRGASQGTRQGSCQGTCHGDAPRD